MKNFIENLFNLTNFKIYRKFKGGSWFYNRRIYDIGRVVIFSWDRTDFGQVGGNLTTLKSENYD